MPPPAASWGRWPQYKSAEVSFSDRFASLPSPGQSSMLAYGNGRSYGDVCLNQNGTLIRTRQLDRFIRLDAEAGILQCEAGVLISEIIDLVLPRGWFPPVAPGTALVTVGGAIANDVHGKNHHRAGCFSHHVVEFELLRSDGRRLKCSMTENREWFQATVGGLGLTGLITFATLQLRRVSGPLIRGDSLRFADLKEFFARSRDSDRDYEYTVAWVDCGSRIDTAGRGVFIRGNHADDAAGDAAIEPRRLVWRVPLTPPISLVNRFSQRLFNSYYYRRSSAEHHDATWHYREFLFPLDGILEWNRIYGLNGFFQYQCVIPEGDASLVLGEMLRRISQSGMGSFLTVLKNFGTIASLGMLSFARCGTTLAIDFPNRGITTLRLLESLDEITLGAGGAVYPAKDARMSMLSFQQYFPACEAFGQFVDPEFSSSFWRRVTGSTE